jgi:repressor of nif and glnA expression
MVVAGGLNPLAAVEEAGFRTGNRAMGTLLPFEQLRNYTEALGEFT